MSDDFLIKNHFLLILVPTLVILLQRTETVHWDENSCSASTQKSVKFDIGSENSSREALNFITYHQLTTIVMPNLRDQLNLIQSNITGNYNTSLVCFIDEKKSTS